MAAVVTTSMAEAATHAAAQSQPQRLPRRPGHGQLHLHEQRRRDTKREDGRGGTLSLRV
jgi:Ni/Co efflux regulator RcnB